MLAYSRKYLKIGPYGLAAGCVIFVALCIRVVLLLLGWPGTNSDEATMGLMARHIAYKGEHPIYIYGQNYMGSLEAHIGAALFFVFGSSLFSLRLSLVLLYIAFLVSMYLLTRLVYSEKLALAIVILFSFGSIELLTRQLKALGGAVETMLFGSLLVLLSSLLVLSFQRNASARTQRRRWSLYGCFGLVMGLGMWSHLLILPFVVCSLGFLLFFCYYELRFLTIASFLLGLLIGFFPSLIYNIQNPSQNSYDILLRLHNTGGTTTNIPFTLWDQIRGTLLVSLPMATGASPVCSVSDVPGVWRTHITSCLLVQGIWSVGFLLLYGLILLFTLRRLMQYYLRSRTATQSNEERKIMLSSAAQLILLLSGGLTLLSYALSPAPALVPITSTRYLVGLLVMFPVLLSPLWNGIRQSYTFCRDRFIASSLLLNCWVDATHQSLWKRRLFLSINIGKGLLCILVYFTYFTAIIGVFQQVPTVQTINQQQYKMIDDLLHMHVTHIYSDYWTCNRIIFQSNERIICSVLNEQLQPGENRYLLYQTTVEHDAQSVYVFQTNSPQAQTIAQRMVQIGKQYAHEEIDNYELYKPI